MPAYRAVPRLELRVKVINAGHRQIGILPYFLFLEDHQMRSLSQFEELKFQFPDAVLHLAEPFRDWW